MYKEVHMPPILMETMYNMYRRPRERPRGGVRGDRQGYTIKRDILPTEFVELCRD